MAERFWKQYHDQGCATCGSPSAPHGFVDFYGDTNVKAPAGDITGIIDIVICSTCLEQAARLVGCASRQEVMDFAQREYDLVTELEKVKDEVVSERQRHEQFVENLYAYRDAGEDT